MHSTPDHTSRRAWRSGPGRKLLGESSPRTALAVVASIFAMLLSLLGAAPASAAPVYEITTRWAEEPPATVRSGDVLTAEWRVNVNDDAAAPSNEPVENVNFTLTLQNGVFTELPAACLVDGVNPVSSISDDGQTLVCNIGTQNQGTAHVVQTPIRVDGETGSQVTGSGSIAGATADLTPVEIVNDFGMDIRWAVATAPYQIDGVGGGGPVTVDLDLQWTLSKDARSEAGPQTITYDLTIASAQATNIAVGPQQCAPFTAGAANGHPWSGGSHPDEAMVSPVDSCTIQKIDADTFRLTLTGIDYDPAAPAAQDSTGAALPVDQVALASGSIWLRLTVTAAGSVSLSSSSPTYTSVGGATAQDDPSNNTVTKTWQFPGTYTSPWNRGWTGSGGSPFDDTYRVAPGTEIAQGLVTGFPGLDRADNLPVGMCAPLDTRYLTFNRMNSNPATEVPGAVIEYFVGSHATVDPTSPAYNPQAFPCDIAGGWTITPPADPSLVKAVRVRMTQGQAEATDLVNAAWHVVSRVKDDVPADQDIWSFMYGQNGDGSWSTVTGCGTATPGLRYPCTTAFRDLVRIVVATPYIEKSGDRSTVVPGEPAGFSLNYSANVASNLPESVDDFQIVDTLPVGMTYVAGSATPEPTVTANGAGQQVLTWVLDGVETNVQHALTYQAVASFDVEPGSTLQNSAVASVAGATSQPATAQVTVSEDGHTEIGKTADSPFVPNLAGDGVGEGSWTVTLRSFDPTAQAFTDTIDILPYNGDDRGTDFAGDYSLTAINAVGGATVYYTTADPATLSDDPADDSNGAAGDPTGNTVGWTTTFTPDATAVRVIGPALAAGATQQFTIEFATDGVEGGDVLVNRAQARTEHTELVMRTSAPITVANFYSAALKKYVQDADGVWRDANDVTDYPSFRPGDTVRYRIVVENTGQGTLRNVVVSDDRYPELGSFTVDELAPGAQQSHEFELVLPEGGADLVTNTACATADIPADSQVPPTINCDPASFEVEGDPTHVKELVSATPIGDGRWELVYGIDVTNTSTHATTYDLADTLHFTDQATIQSAEVTASPAGVTLADPAWDGQSATDIATDVPLLGSDDAGYAPHRYEVTIVADVPLQLDGAGSGAGDPTACGPDGDDADRAFNNTSALTDPAGDVEDDQACASIPSIDITKAVSGGPTPNGDGTWTVTYDIVATNSGTADGVYDVRDRMTADGDLVVESGAITATPDGVTASPTWTGLGADDAAPENVIASGVTLPAGGVHTYQVEVVLSFESEGAPVITPCDATTPGAGGLSNSAQIEHNDLTDDAQACVTITSITVDKTVASGPTPNGDGTYTVVYEVVAENIGPAAGEYDVYDRLRFGDGIEIESAEATGPDGVDVEDGWTGQGPADESAENLLAGTVALAAGASHTYTIEVVVSVDESVVEPADLACPPPGSGEAGGLANGTLLDHNGIPAVDEVCPSLPLIDIDKEISSGPTPNGDGTWTIVYDLVASNTGAAEGEYDIADELQFGEGIVIESADVTAVPAGVADPASWDGRDETTIATGVPLAAGATHTYRVQAVVSLDTETVTPADLACPPPGSGAAGGLANTVELTHNGETQDDDACAPLPLIDIAKSVAGAVTPVDGEDGVYDVSYQITVTNSGPGAGSYDLDDTLTVGEGVTVRGVQDVTTDAPESVGINPGFGTDGDTRIVTGQPIAGASGGAATVHTYTVTVRYALDLSAVETPAVDGCTTPGGGVADGTLHNVAAVDWNGIVDEDDECVIPGRPTLDKQLVSAEPVGDGRWQVVYDLTVGNTGNEITTYDLDDEFLFAPSVTTDAVQVTGPEGVAIDGSFNGETELRIATDVAIAGLDDPGYAPHVYTVSVLVSVPLRLDEVAPDGTGSAGCTVPAGGNLLEQGLNNAATLTDETDGTITDTDCAPLPSIDITKSIVGAPAQSPGGQWSITYEIVATNDGAQAGAYTVTDRLRFGAGIEVTSAVVSASPEGVTLADGWTGLGAEGAAENVVAEGVLGAGATHTYRVVVTASVHAAEANGSTWSCPAPGSDEPGGFANTAGISHNGLTDGATACATPPPPPLALTGGGAVGAGVIGAAVLLLLGGGVLLLLRRRTRVVDHHDVE